MQLNVEDIEVIFIHSLKHVYRYYIPMAIYFLLKPWAEMLYFFCIYWFHGFEKNIFHIKVLSLYFLCSFYYMMSTHVCFLESEQYKLDVIIQWKNNRLESLLNCFLRKSTGKFNGVFYCLALGDILQMCVHVMECLWQNSNH